MSHQMRDKISLAPEPSRPLRTDFTARTVDHTLTAKRRAQNRQKFKAFHNKNKGLFSMKKLAFLRTAHGAVLTVAVISTVGASAYALTNWFDGSVGVHQNGLILSVDLSQCKGPLPAGINTTNRSDVQFKIVGNPHISAADLQQKLLVECEYDSVLSFYANQPTTANSNIYTGTVVNTNGNQITVAYAWDGTTRQKAFTLPSGATVYNQSAATELSSLQKGDIVAFAVSRTFVSEEVDPLSQANEVQSVFKIQYNVTQALSASKNGFYQDNNIAPLN